MKEYSGIFYIEIDDRDKIEEILKDLTKKWGIKFEDITQD